MREVNEEVVILVKVTCNMVNNKRLNCLLSQIDKAKARRYTEPYESPEISTFSHLVQYFPKYLLQLDNATATVGLLPLGSGSMKQEAVYSHNLKLTLNRSFISILQVRSYLYIPPFYPVTQIKKGIRKNKGGISDHRLW